MIHKLPDATRYSNLVLKKGFITDQKIFDWWMDINMGSPVTTRDLKLILLDQNGTPAATWKINKAFPVVIEAVERQEDKSRIAIEKMEFAFESVERES